ncbi:MAG TPA: SDR family NAD(P)-dependent oxidoreductase, partial [Chthoniobacterales bacterium]
MNIEGRKVLISGASRGLGRALAFAFAEAGAREVFAGARKPEDIDELRRAADAVKAAITPIKLEVRNDEDIAALQRLGAIEILVNNAGVAGYGNPVSMRFETAREEMDVNF